MDDDAIKWNKEKRGKSGWENDKSLSLEVLTHLRHLLSSLIEVSSKNLTDTEIYYGALVGSYAESSPLENDRSTVQSEQY